MSISTSVSIAAELAEMTFQEKIKKEPFLEQFITGTPVFGTGERLNPSYFIPEDKTQSVLEFLENNRVKGYWITRWGKNQDKLKICVSPERALWDRDNA